MSAPNANFIWRTFGAESAPNKPEPLKGKGFSAKRAKWARVLAQKPRIPLRRGSEARSAQRQIQAGKEASA